MPADLEERRFCVLDVSDRRRVDYDYFGAIGKEMKNGGREALLYELLDREIKSNLRQIPRTQALLDQIIQSMGSLEKWWLTCLHQKKISEFDESWPESMLPEDVYSSYRDYCAKEHERHPVSRSPFFRNLRKLCPGIKLKKMDLGIGRNNYSCFPHLDQCHGAFEDLINITIPWDDDTVPF